MPELKQLRDRLRTKIMVLLLTTPAAVTRPETWQRLAEQFAAARNALKGGEGAILASVHGLLDVVTGLSMAEQPKAAETAA